MRSRTGGVTYGSSSTDRHHHGGSTTTNPTFTNTHLPAHRRTTFAVSDREEEDEEAITPPRRQRKNLTTTEPVLRTRRTLSNTSPPRIKVLPTSSRSTSVSPKSHRRSNSLSTVARSGAGTTTTKTGLITQQSEKERSIRVLSPLPVNHQLHHRRITSTKDTKASLQGPTLGTVALKHHRSSTSARAVSDDQVSATDRRRAMTRRGSQSHQTKIEPSIRGIVGRKRKKVPEETEDEEMMIESQQRGRRSRNTDTHEHDPATSDIEHEEQDEDEDEDEDEEEDEQDGDEYEDEEADEDEDDEVVEDDDLNEEDHYHIYDASATQLRRLKRDELERLYRLASGADQADVEILHKDDLVTLLLETRGEANDAASTTASEDEEEASDEEASPRPSTSQETSPALEQDSPSPRKKARASQGRRSSRTRQDARVPISLEHPSSNANEVEDDDEEEEISVKRSTRARSLSESKLGGDSKSRAMTRRQSHDAVSITTSASSSSAQGSKRMTRRSSNQATPDDDEGVRTTRSDKRSSLHLKGKGKAVSFNAIEDEEELEIDDEDLTNGSAGSPIAHRTRGGSVAPPDTVRPTAPSIVRAAKLKAVAKIVNRGERRSSRSNRRAGEPGSYVEGDDEEMMDCHGDHTEQETTPTRRTTRRGRALEPPSDADEESGGDEIAEHGLVSETDEEAETFEVSSYLRAPRQLRNGKVVPLNIGDDEDIEDEDEDLEEVEEEEEDQEMIDGEEVDLANATSKSLLRHRKDDLVRLCEERELQGDGTKKELVQALLEWRDADFDHSSGGSPADSSGSNTSVETARGETKTQALKRAATVSTASAAETPLLMRHGHSRSPDKPRSRGRSRAAAAQALHDITEEINGLDLESLQLQDKEIAPEKLTKLEKVGSGGFKDVYKGLYRRKTIAICDIRGHLTEMDIKELGLLRDLRHPNIVHFIGVSIPKEPSSVPVMIVTELCANGDLFDYLRGVPHPPFSSMIEIMLGIARGVEYLHTRKPSIIHRDIKSSNVLITAQGVAKMADFGLARVKNTTRSVIKSLVGTVNWQAPELWVAHPKYNEKVDVYSVGLVFWEVLQWHQPVKRYPFEGLNEHAIYDQVGHKKIRPSTASMRRQWGGEILDLVGTMWDHDHSVRPPMTQVVLELEVLLSSAKEQDKAQKDLERSGRASR